MAADNRRVEEICASLLREYLSRKGLRTTLQVLDEEMPRTQFSISNRQTLAKELQIDRLMKANKEQDVPLRAMLEVITKALLDKEEVTSSRSHADYSDPPVRPSRKDFDFDSLGTPAKDVGGSSELPVRPSRKDFDSIGMVAKDVNCSSSLSRHKAFKASLKANTDLLLEDVVASESMAGEGKVGIFNQAAEETASLGGKPRQARPFSGKTRGQQMIMSNDMVDRRRPLPTRPREMGRPIMPNSLEPAKEVPAAGKSKNVMDILNAEKPSRESSFHNSKARMSAPQNLFSTEPKDGGDSVDRTAATRDVRSASRNSGRHYRINSVEDIFDPDKRSLQRNSSTESRDSGLYSVEASSMASDRPPTRNSSRPPTEQSSTSTVGDLEIGDCDDLDFELQNLNITRPPATRAPLLTALESTPISTQLAIELRMLIFGTGMRSFNDEWKMQSLSFCDLPGLEYGIAQRKGGPCGVLAAVQACMLQEMLFGAKKLPQSRCLEPTRTERSDFLASALSCVLWRAGGKQGIVVMPSNKTSVYNSGKYKQDGLTETLVLYRFSKLEELQIFMKQSINQFEQDGNSGVILLLYSAILSRGIDNVKKDMDEEGMALMGAHGYCTQEMVNIIVTGRATSNVFNNVVELESDDGSVTTLKGIFSRSDIGFLSLFEHYKSCQVGTFYKTPKFPIWVVCCESHFSVLFSTKADLVNDWKAERHFDLYYYDGLARQQEEIRLTIDTTMSWTSQGDSSDDLIPPLEHCIRTKWSDCVVNWNGTEPML